MRISLLIRNLFLQIAVCISVVCDKAFCQDTFSIVAIDTITGEVGSAGASCVDLTPTSLAPDFISQLIPGVGAINTQSYYQPQNQQNAYDKLIAGELPQQIVDWLDKNDCQNKPEIRQYGVVAFVGFKPDAASYTGISCLGWKGERVGPHYAIQGNILLGPEILDSMEQAFLNTKGPLAEKLMATLQAAKIPGADLRCRKSNVSSHFAFIKIAKPTDDMENPYLNLGLKTSENSGIEPIDSLQALYNEWKANRNNGEDAFWKGYVSISPIQNEKDETLFYINLSTTTGTRLNGRLYNNFGKEIENFSTNGKEIKTFNLKPGIYYLELNTGDKQPFIKKFMVY